MIEELVKYDTELFLFLNKLGNTSWDGFWRIVTEKWSSIPIYAVLLYLIYKHYGLKGTLIIFVSVALMITATDQLSNLFKHGIKRPRPCQVESLRETMRYVAERCGRYGYFSAHAASSMAAAVFLGLSLKKWYVYLPFLLLFWSAVVAYSRIYLGVHYPLDIITGMLIGGLLGWGFYKFQIWAQRRFLKDSAV
ncbi:phosphatase PAP2 family protein [Marixanthomonas sp. SCSIO 43207]|uniref:phosphatase PAP2 family protein n=1 Tax=Marixanthomonas sp. SCSIO 43207 TaxID=2779360 RepID=UPI001CA92D54|nr:phosphatase PAP2 family protein [Marixanthomonas sp. SCSIO 43207]UAB81265.1 phosphatase PAP2 family protein [Marixanthomonas sp. SCSIO 43207]